MHLGLSGSHLCPIIYFFIDMKDSIMNTITIQIDGMTCGGCVKSVQRVLSELAGVQQAEVSLSPAQAVITFNPAKVSVANLVTAIEDAGFDAQTV